jgi:hypothetical protein
MAFFLRYVLVASFRLPSSLLPLIQIKMTADDDKRESLLFLTLITIYYYNQGALGFFVICYHSNA